MSITGVYSVVASAIAGSSLGVVHIQDGKVTGNDIAGAEYSGDATRNPDGSVTMLIRMSTPPGVFHIWTGGDTETFQSRDISLQLPKASFEDGKPYEMPQMGMTIIVRRVPDVFAGLAGPEGRKHLINDLLSAEQAWNAYRAR